LAFLYPHAGIGPAGEGVSDALAVVLVELGRRLVERGCAVTAFIRRRRGEPALSVLDGIRLRRVLQPGDHLLFRLRLLERLGILPPDRPLRVTPLYYPFFVRTVAAELARSGVDIVHLHNNAVFLPVLRRHLPQADLVLHQHDHALADFAPEWTRARLALAQLVLGCSDHVRARVLERFPEIGPRAATLHNGVDARFLDVASDPGASRTILYVGRLAPEKGVHLLLEAFDRIADRHPDARLELVGDWSFSPKEFVDPFDRDPAIRPLAPWFTRPAAWRRHLEKLAARRPGRIRFRGPMLNRDLPAVMATAALFAFPTLWQEPFGMPPVEAMAAGLPVVSGRAGALPETVEHGRSGLLVERGSIEALAGALDALLSDPERRRAMGAAGRARVLERFRWETIADRLLELYRAHCPNAGAAPSRPGCASPS
jgi:glycosyltransferase involved in cell wall biosynthesis